MVLTGKNGVRIKSFVVFDLETSGLHPRTRITEIGLVAAVREHICDAFNSSVGLPRVLHKLNLCVYPNRLIEPGACNVSGLDNMLLQEQKPFDCDVFSILESFLCRLPPPVCLVAHNGDRFDFPVLQAELERIKKVLPDDLMCADSLKCFKEIFAHKNAKSPASNDCDKPAGSIVGPESTLPQLNYSGEENLSSIQRIASELGIYPLTGKVELEDEFDGVLLNMLERLEKNSGAVNLGIDDVTCRTPFKHSDPVSCDVKQQNETTPTTSVENISFLIQHDPQGSSEIIGTISTTPSTSQIQQHNETTPRTRISGSHFTGDDMSSNTTSSKKRIGQNSVVGVRKRLNFALPANEVGASPKSFKLTDVYQFLIGSKAVNAHTADGDALNLLKCIVAVGSDFLEWTDDNAHQFSEVIPRR